MTQQQRERRTVHATNALCKMQRVRLKVYVLYDSIYMTFWERQNYRTRT